MGLTDESFTPSEYILLNGEKFAPAAEEQNSLALLCSEAQVNGHRLVIHMIMAAILANESEKCLEIKIQEKKRLLGSSVKREIFLHAVRPSPNWAGYTLEAAVMFITGNLYATQQHTLYNIIYTLLAKDRPKPWEKVVEMVEWGLASSNWLIPVKGEAAAAFSIPFICPGNVRELAVSQSIEPVLALFTGCKQRRPELWEEMTAEIERALQDRRK